MSYGKYTYLLSGEKENWFEARRLCKSINGELASIASNEENEKIKLHLALIFPLNIDFWIKDKVDGQHGCKKQSMTSQEIKVNQTCSQSSHFICKLRGSRYLFVTDKMSWSASRSYCQKLNGDLVQATIDDIKQISKIRAGEKRFWIGINDNRKEGVYKWDDGLPYTFKNWLQGEPNNYNDPKRNENCVEFRKGDGRWNDISCVSKRPSACVVKGKLVFLGIYKIWKDARSYCKELSGELLSIHSKGQNDEIQQYSKSFSRCNWIGLNDRDVEGNFTWSDGAAYHYKHWSKNEPNNAFGNEDCVEIFAHRSGNGRWNDQTCSKALNAVCKIQAAGKEPKYLISAKKETWQKSRTFCRSLGGDIVSIDNATENKSVTGMLLNVTKMHSFWIGYNDRRQEGNFAWSDGKQNTYANWAPKEPNNNGTERGENCGEYLWDKGGTWNDDKCGIQKMFLCKKANGKVSTTSTFGTPSQKLRHEGTSYHTSSGEYTRVSIFDTTTRKLELSRESTISTTTQKLLIKSMTYNGNSDVLLIGLVSGFLVLILCLLICGFVFYFKKRRRESDEQMEMSDICLSQEKICAVDEWEIPIENITFGELIGKGAFGRVYSAKLSKINIAHGKSSLTSKNLSDAVGQERKMHKRSENAITVAVKTIHNLAADAQQEREFLQEIELMKEIGQHKHIVSMIGCVTRGSPLCLIVEYMPGKDLLQYLREKRSKLLDASGYLYPTKFLVNTSNQRPSCYEDADGLTSQVLLEKTTPDVKSSIEEEFTPAVLLQFAWQISCGMEHLALKGFVHRDLAARNVLLGPDNSCKVSDFGLTRHVYEENVYTSKKSRKLPIKWMSIEAIVEERFTSYSDVWAFGVVLFELATLGGTPYPTLSAQELLHFLQAGNRMKRPENCSEELYCIMQSCWRKVPTKRPTFTELKSTLEHLMSQESPYIELAVDKNQEYYLMPSFRSIAESDENDGGDNDEDDDKGFGDDDDGSGGGDNDNHSTKVVGNLPNTKEPRYKTLFEC